MRVVTIVWANDLFVFQNVAALIILFTPPCHSLQVLKVGPFHEHYQTLSQRHHARGDITAALIALERGADRHPRWGCGYHTQSMMFVPHMHNHLAITTRLPNAAKWLTHPPDVRYRTLGRSAEARDAMTAALSMPMWTLGDVDLLDAAKVFVCFA